MDVFGRVPTYRKGIKRMVDVHGGVGTFQKKVDASWWLSGGIDPATVAGVWQPKGAASLDASYLRLAGDEGYADIDPAVVGGVAPTFGADGWVFNGSTQYLDSGVITNDPQSWSMLLCFSGGIVAGTYCAIGAYNKVFSYNVWQIYTNRSTNEIRYVSGLNTYYETVSPGIESGVAGISGRQGYRNGIADGTLVSCGVPSIDGIEVFLGALNYNVAGGATQFWAGKIQAVVFYKSTLTAPQVLAVSQAMAAL